MIAPAKKTGPRAKFQEKAGKAACAPNTSPPKKYATRYGCIYVKKEMEMTNQEKEDIYDWALDQEYQLTFYQVIKLLRIVEGMDESGPEAPICIPFLPKKEKTPLWQAPYHLSSGSLMQLAQDRQLMDLGLIKMCDSMEYLDTLDYEATTKGEMVAEWMISSLEDLGFTHPSLISVNHPDSRLRRDF